jgi:hypothetical protein
MSLLGCTGEKDSLKTWAILTVEMRFSGVTSFTDTYGMVSTKIWNGGEEYAQSQSWTREHPTKLQIKTSYPSTDKFWVTNQCCCWQCQFSLFIQDSSAKSEQIRPDPSVGFEIPWETFEDGVSTGTGSDIVHPVFRRRYASDNDRKRLEFCKNESGGEPTREKMQWKVSWTNTATPYALLAGTTITNTRTYTGSDGKTNADTWSGVSFNCNLTEGSGLYNNELGMEGCCGSDQIFMQGKIDWLWSAVPNIYDDYSSSATISQSVSLTLEP